MEQAKIKAPKQHKLTDQHPVISALLFGLIGIIAIELFGQMLNIPIHAVIKAYPMECGPIGILIAFVVGAAYYREHFKPEYQGIVTGGNLKTGFLLIIVQLVYTLAVAGKDLLSGCVFHAPTFVSVSTALMAGIMEELAFRGYMISTMMRQWKRDENRILTALIVSAAAFGGIHMLNLTAGAPLGVTIFQTINAGFIGVFLGAVYLRSGNLLPVAFGHFFHDFIAYVVSSPDSSENLVMGGGVDASLLIEGVMTAVLAGIGIWMLRKEKRGEILAVWQEKWTDAEGTENVQESSNE